MPKIYRHTARRNAGAGTCFRCGKPIAKGDAYGSYSVGFRGPTRKFHDVSACQPRAVDLESNDKKIAVITACDELSNAQNANNPEDAAGYVLSARDSVQEAIDSMQNAVDNWDSANLTGSQMYENFSNDVANLEDWVREAEQVASDLEEWTSDEDDPDDAESDDSWRQLLDTLDQPELSW